MGAGRVRRRGKRGGRREGGARVGAPKESPRPAAGGELSAASPAASAGCLPVLRPPHNECRPPSPAKAERTLSRGRVESARARARKRAKEATDENKRSGPKANGLRKFSSESSPAKAAGILHSVARARLSPLCLAAAAAAAPPCFRPNGPADEPSQHRKKNSAAPPTRAAAAAISTL